MVTETLQEIGDGRVALHFDRVPEPARARLLELRQIILEAARTANAGPVEETLKWGEPAYLTKEGSTVRIDWKERSPHEVAMYFHCQTSLVDTFRALYGDLLRFEGNRAILLGLDDEVPVEAIGHCVALALTYHRVKHLPLLGA